MRIAVITQDDTFYIGRFFEAFLDGLPTGIELRAAVVCRTMGKSPFKLAADLLEFYGPVDFVRMLARYGKGKLLAQTVGRVSRSHPQSLTQLFRSRDIEVIPTRNVNGKLLRQRLMDEKLDLIVSVAAPQLFKGKLLGAARLGCINIHTARLPKYRGMMPNFWVLYHGDKRSAITIHTMDVEIDRGKLLMQHEFEIDPAESLDQLIKRTKRLGAECMLRALAAIAERGLEPREFPDLAPSYFSFPRREHVRHFRRLGRKLI
jgi:methionyl-tRNA formyltransferase